MVKFELSECERHELRDMFREIEDALEDSMWKIDTLFHKISNLRTSTHLRRRMDSLSEHLQQAQDECENAKETFENTDSCMLADEEEEEEEEKEEPKRKSLKGCFIERKCTDGPKFFPPDHKDEDPECECECCHSSSFRLPLLLISIHSDMCIRFKWT